MSSKLGQLGVTFPDSTVQATRVGTGWTSVDNIAIGDIFTGYSADYVTPGSTLVTNTSINTTPKYWFINWPTDQAFASSIMYGNGVYLTAKNAGKVGYSVDAVNWSTVQVLPNLSANDFNYMAFGNGVFVVVGASGNLLTSPDGITWTPRTSGTTAGLEYVAFAGGRFVACGATGWVTTSSDNGVTWTALQDPNTTSTHWQWQFDGTRYVFCLGTGNISYCTDPANTATYTFVTTNISGFSNPALYTIAYDSGSGRWVTGGDYISNAPPKMWATTNPTSATWTQINSFPAYGYLVNRIYYWQQGNLWIGVNNTGDIAYCVNDGLYNWTRARLATATGTYNLNDVTYLNGKLLTGGTGGLIASTADTNQIYVEHNEVPAPAGTYRCLGGVDPAWPIYLWTRTA